eukprot:1473848-Pyramimonas_sp.AAC.1
MKKLIKGVPRDIPNARHHGKSYFFLPRLCLEGFLLSVLKWTGQYNPPWAVPPVPWERFPQSPGS